MMTTKTATRDTSGTTTLFGTGFSALTMFATVIAFAPVAMTIM